MLRCALFAVRCAQCAGRLAVWRVDTLASVSTRQQTTIGAFVGALARWRVGRLRRRVVSHLFGGCHWRANFGGE